MKKFSLLIYLLLTGCVSVPLAVNVVDDCNSKYFGQYYGNCIWETYEFHPNKEKYIEAYNYKTDWLEITQINNMLLDSLEQNNISVSDANKLFMARFSLLTEKDAARVNRENARIAAALGNLSQTMKENSALNNPTANAPQRLSRYELIDNKKVCYYGFGITGKTLVVGLTAKCPDYL